MNLRISINLVAMLSVAVSMALVSSNAHANGYRQTYSQRQSSDHVAARQGLPGRRISGGTRSPVEQCVAADAQPLVAIVPNNNLGTTAKATPTLWFSVPSVHSTRHLEFGLFDQDNELIYRTQLAAPDQAGLVGIDLAELEQAPLLRPDEAYRWSLAVVCNSENRSEDLWVDGWIQHTEQNSPLALALDETAPSEVAQLYLDNGFWQEAVTHLLTESDAPSTEWVALSDWHWLTEAAGLDPEIITSASTALPIVEIQEIAQ